MTISIANFVIGDAQALVDLGAEQLCISGTVHTDEFSEIMGITLWQRFASVFERRPQRRSRGQV